jgi:hypothetical protein
MPQSVSCVINYFNNRFYCLRERPTHDVKNHKENREINSANYHYEKEGTERIYCCGFNNHFSV